MEIEERASKAPRTTVRVSNSVSPTTEFSGKTLLQATTDRFSVSLILCRTCGQKWISALKELSTPPLEGDGVFRLDPRHRSNPGEVGRTEQHLLDEIGLLVGTGLGEQRFQMRAHRGKADTQIGSHFFGATPCHDAFEHAPFRRC